MPVTVIIPARNAETTIARTLKSLSTDRAVIGEILVIDDGSDDATAEVAEHEGAMAGLPVRITRFAGGSAAAARSRGMDLATCEMIFFIDADDELLPGGLVALVDALKSDAGAVLAVGCSLRHAAGERDRLRKPAGYGEDPLENAASYVMNAMPPVSVGSALLRAGSANGILFPRDLVIDEDTWFWAAVMTRGRVVTVDMTVMAYHLDRQRDIARYLESPKKRYLETVRAFRHLGTYGINPAALKWRRAWLAQRFVRQLIKSGRYEEARSMLRPARAHAAFRIQRRTMRYSLLAASGALLKGNRCAKPDRPPYGQVRTLVVTHDPVWPSVSGADIRNGAIVGATGNLGPVHVVSVRSPEPGSPSLCPVTALALPGGSNGAAVNRFRISGEPRLTREMIARMRQAVDEFRPDVAIVEGIGLQALLKPLRGSVDHLILDMHNIESDLAAQNGRSKAGSFRKAIRAARLPAALRRRERKALGLVDAVWTSTTADRSRLVEIFRPRTPVHVVPNPIPLSCPSVLPEEAGRQPLILFAGHLGYWPNIEACERLARFILPAIRNANKDVRLVLAGRYPHPAISELGALPGVAVVANPPDMGALLSVATLSVMPISSGGGSRIKILEAAAWGVPVVATPKAAEGLELVDGRDILVAESDSGLAGLALGLLGDDRLRQRMRESAHAAVWRFHGSDAILRAVAKGMAVRSFSYKTARISEVQEAP